jgi:hypothetical protein
MISHEFGIAGCEEDCKRSHLQAGTVQRLLAQGIPRDLIEDALEYEMTSHGPVRAFSGLTHAGIRHLREWGATDSEIVTMELSDAGQREPIQLDFAARERARVGKYRAGLESALRDKNQTFRDLTSHMLPEAAREVYRLLTTGNLKDQAKGVQMLLRHQGLFVDTVRVQDEAAIASLLSKLREPGIVEIQHVTPRD